MVCDGWILIPESSIDMSRRGALIKHRKKEGVDTEMIRPLRCALLLILMVTSHLGVGCDRRQPTPEAQPAKEASSSTTGDIGSAAGIEAARNLPPPFHTKSAVNFPKLIGWSGDRKPLAAQGFRVTLYADGLDHPRWLYVLANGDVLVAESRTEPPKSDSEAKNLVEGLRQSGQIGKSANRITLLRDADKDGKPDVREVFLSNLNQPFGMLLLGDTFYVANTDGLLRFPYRSGQTHITAQGQKILDLPAGGYNNHWTRNVIANPRGTKLYVSVGSGSNVAEHGMDNERRRAAILAINPDGTGEDIFASGLRNPNGMDWEPQTGALWTAVNERDGLGDDLVPDYITSVRAEAFYGWPYSYFGQHEDPRRKGERPDLVARAVIPDYPLGAHTACLGMLFYRGTAFPQQYRGGAFVAQHGSWNRSQLSGYKVVFVPFRDGKPSGAAQDFLTGFIADEGTREVYGRPVGLAMLADGSLLVADDAGNSIWRVAPSESTAARAREQ
jgi:glucose/arabinose dehydrogenase